MNTEQNSPNRAHRGTVHFDVAEQVYACMETGNHEHAAQLMREYDAEYPAESRALRLSLIRDYGKEV